MHALCRRLRLPCGKAAGNWVCLRVCGGTRGDRWRPSDHRLTGEGRWLIGRGRELLAGTLVAASVRGVMRGMAPTSGPPDEALRGRGKAPSRPVVSAWWASEPRAAGVWRAPALGVCVRQAPWARRAIDARPAAEGPPPRRPVPCRRLPPPVAAARPRVVGLSRPPAGVAGADPLGMPRGASAPGGSPSARPPASCASSWSCRRSVAWSAA